MRRFLLGILETLGIALLCVVAFGVDPKAALLEVFWFYVIVGVLALVIMIYGAYALTRAMNPKPKKDNNKV